MHDLAARRDLRALQIAILLLNLDGCLAFGGLTRFEGKSLESDRSPLDDLGHPEQYWVRAIDGVQNLVVVVLVKYIGVEVVKAIEARRRRWVLEG